MSGAPRAVVAIGAATNIGIRPYDGAHEPRRLDRAPAVLRALGLLDRLGAQNLGDVTPAPYEDFVRPRGGVRNERQVVEYSRSLADRVEAGANSGRFVLVLGGDCSIVLGSLLGAGRGGRRMGLVYVDAHADFATPEESMTGSAASMCLALAVGRGDSPLARLGGPEPLVRAQHVVTIGRRDAEQSWYGEAALQSSGILDLSEGSLEEHIPPVADAALDRVGQGGLDGFWIHVDADVLNPDVMPAVDSPEPGGPGIDELARLLAALVRHPRALGMQLTIYDPALDRNLICARRLVTLLEKTFIDEMGRILQ